MMLDASLIVPWMILAAVACFASRLTFWQLVVVAILVGFIVSAAIFVVDLAAMPNFYQSGAVNR